MYLIFYRKKGKKYSPPSIYPRNPEYNQLFFHPINHYFTMKKVILLLTMLLAFIMVSAQQPSNEVVYQHSDLGNGKFQFEITQKPALGLSTNPPKEPYFEYYWEFGDGTYLVTTDETITHTYAKSGAKDVLLKTTRVYDDGDDPPAKMINPSKPNAQLTSGALEAVNPTKITEGERLEIDLNRTSTNVRPDEENTIILQYKNDKRLGQSGRIYLFYNEKAKDEDGDYVKQFNLLGMPRIYADAKTVNEQRMQSGATNDANPTSLLPASTRGTIRKLVTDMLGDFENYEAFSFTGLPAGTQSNIFVSLQTDSDIGDIEGKDIKIKAMLISGSEIDTTSIDLTVAKAHDPNKISVNEVRENFRRVENRFLTYKVQFQNDGEAPAKDVIVEVEIPEGLEIKEVAFLPRSLDMKYVKDKTVEKFDGDKTTVSYQVENLENGAKFTFRNVNLPGLKEKHIKKYKETTGSFRYKIQYRDKLKKEPLKSRAHIVFRDEFGDRKPVTTSYTTTRFKPGLSLGPKAGVSLSLGDSLPPTYFIGVVASPYKSDKFYLQVEGLVSYGQFSCDYEPGIPPPSDCKFIGSQVDSMGLAEIPVFDLDTLIRTETSEYYVGGSNLALHIPVQIRRDLNKFISFGAGAELGIEFRRSTFLQNMETQEIEHFWDAGWIPLGDPDVSLAGEVIEKNSTHFSSSVFADVLIGSVKVGPAIGVRYLRGVVVPKIQGDVGEITPGKDRLQVFAQWKF